MCSNSSSQGLGRIFSKQLPVVFGKLAHMPEAPEISGIEPNRKALNALFQYSHEQGLAAKRLTIEELFVPSTLELVK